MWRRATAILLLLVTLVARDAHADLVVSAPPSLSAYAERINRIDPAALAGALASAGLEMPSEVRITLVAEADTAARTVPDWVAGLAWGDRDIVIFPERVIAYPYDSLESVVRHEVTHLALNARAGGAPLPRWFHEGVATSVDSGWKTSAQFQLLLAMLARPDTAGLTRLFVSSESDTRQAYLLSALLLHDLRERHGPAMPGAVARRVASGMSFDDAFRAETGASPDAAADAAWASYRRWTAWVPAVTSPSAAWTLILLLAFVAFAAQRRRRAARRRQWDDESHEDHRNT